MSDMGVVIPGIDVEAGLELVGGSMEILEMILVTYVEEGEKTKNDIRSSYEKGDIANYTVYTHGLKSASRSIGANALADHAFEHEKMGKANDVEGISADVDSLLEEFDVMLNNINKYLVENDLI